MNVIKHLRDWRGRIEALGATIERVTESKHFKLYVRSSRGEKHVFVMPRGSANGREAANRLAELRRRLG